MGNYYEDSEQIGNELFTKWAKEVNIFSEMKRQPLLSRVDWICQSIKGSTINCELKVEILQNMILYLLNLRNIIILLNSGMRIE